MRWREARVQVKERPHTDAAEQRRFLAMPQQEQLLEIFLNGRETNGHVADLYEWKEERDAKDVVIEAKVEAHDRWIGRLVGIGLFILGAAPFVFFGLNVLRDIWGD